MATSGDCISQKELEFCVNKCMIDLTPDIALNNPDAIFGNKVKERAPDKSLTSSADAAGMQESKHSRMNIASSADAAGIVMLSGIRTHDFMVDRKHKKFIFNH